MAWFAADLIRCLSCNTVTATPAKFSELDLTIKDVKELDESLRLFLQPEDLVGDDRYDCSACGTRRDATRQIVLTRIPPVLNLQLLRFVFVECSSDVPVSD